MGRHRFNLSGISHETPPTRRSCSCLPLRGSFNLSGISHETPHDDPAVRRDASVVSTCPGSLTRPHSAGQRPRRACRRCFNLSGISHETPLGDTQAMTQPTDPFQPVRDLSRDPTPRSSHLPGRGRPFQPVRDLSRDPTCSSPVRMGRRRTFQPVRDLSRDPTNSGRGIAADSARVSTCPGSLTRPHVAAGQQEDIGSWFQPVRDLSRDPTCRGD